MTDHAGVLSGACKLAEGFGTGAFAGGYLGDKLGKFGVMLLLGRACYWPVA
jgi:hypothetical protein